MPDIVLTTLNARYIHASFGLRYLRANLGALRERSTIVEFEASQRTVDILERILSENPRIVGVGVYIWNAVQSLQLVSELKRLRPDIAVIVGGPEVSHETDQQEICRVADYVITGEADLAFAALCEDLLTKRRRPLIRRIEAQLPHFAPSASGQSAAALSAAGASSPIVVSVRHESAARSEENGSRTEEGAFAPREGTDHSREWNSHSREWNVHSRVERAASADADDDSRDAAAPSTAEADASRSSSEEQGKDDGAGAGESGPNDRNKALILPYDEYTADDLAHRVIYVEASRGCPFSCEFCLSSLDVPVRNVPLEPFLAQMRTLFDRGCRQFKFVDRTFNLNLAFATAILTFFLERYEPGLFVHFEMVPDRLPEGLRAIIRQFPAGALQFEVGIQTFNPEVEKLISRRQNHEKLIDNLRWLRAETGVHVHADLIVGLPGEDVASFGRGFDLLVGLGPQEIQVGMLKRLRGTPIVRHDTEWGMVYSPAPPYEVLQTKLVSFVEMQRMRRFSRYWDLIANSGSFTATLKRLLGETPFASFARFSDWLWQAGGQRTHGFALHALAEKLQLFLTTEGGEDPVAAANLLLSDFNRTERDAPASILKLATIRPTLRARRDRVAPTRQSRHLSEGAV